MTKQEFAAWLDRWGAAFPDDKAWMEQGTPDDLRERKRMWFDTVKHHPATHLDDVLERMVAGRDETPTYHTDRRRWPQYIDRALAKAETRHAQPVKSSEPAPTRFTPAAKAELQSIRAQAAEYAKVEKAGATPEQLQAWLEENVTQGNEDRKRVTCLLCNDRRVVDCWHPMAINAYAATGEIPRGMARTMAVPCSCPQGDPPPHASEEKLHRVRYDPDKHALCPNGFTRHPENVRNISEFIKRRQNMLRVSEFDDFNRRVEA